MIVTDRGVTPDDGPLTPLAQADEGSGLRVIVPPDADAAALVAASNRFALIAVAFPKFSDGRGFSLARRLRDLGYRGRLRATGHLIPDQFAFARACGFDEVAVEDALHVRQGEGAWAAARGRAAPPFARRRAISG
jgi:uncharacterized protein (DUF934 family)